MTTKTKTEPSRFNIVGSFLRPKKLKEKWAKFEKSEMITDLLKNEKIAELVGNPRQKEGGKSA
jgi:methionine synthase II (cobalamin-independent)